MTFNFYREERNILQKTKIGLVASPEFPTKLANNLVDKLPSHLNQQFGDNISWEIEVVTDSLTAVAEDLDELNRDLEQYMKEKEWDYIFCLTDLPDFSENNIPRLARVNLSKNITLLSIPAFGWSTQKRIEKMLIQILQKAYYKSSDKVEESKAPTLSSHKYHVEESQNEGGHYLYYLFRSKWLGHLIVLLGMAYANSPWQLMVSLRSVLAIAFTTGAYGLIFPTMWLVSNAFSIARLLALSGFAIFSVSIWIIYSHGLWEKNSKRTDNKLRRLYNSATVLTLSFGVLSYYVVLMVLFFIFIAFIVPPDLYSSQVGLSRAPVLLDYIKLGWFATSIATTAGAIGVGLEEEDEVRNIAYGYRQRKRYKEVEKAREKEEKEEDKDTEGENEDA